MKNKIIVILVCTLLIIPVLISTAKTNICENDLAPEIEVGLIDCTTAPVIRDQDEKFSAEIINNKDSEVEVWVEWYYDYHFLGEERGIIVPALGSAWTGEMEEHWPYDFQRHWMGVKIFYGEDYYGKELIDEKHYPFRAKFFSINKQINIKAIYNGDVPANIVNEAIKKTITVDDEISPLTNGDKWMKTFGLSAFDYGNSVQQTSDGGYIIAGQSSPSGDLNYDIFLIKTDNQGSKIWDNSYGGEKRDQANSVKQTNDGGYIITGTTLSFGAGNSDIWLIKTDSNGNKLWDKTFGTSGNEWGFDVIEISSGGFLIVGQTGPSDPWYLTDVYIIKTDSGGNKIWDKTFGGDHHDDGRPVQEVNDGGFIITGDLCKDSSHPDIMLLKIDSEGNILWDKTFDKNDIDHGNSVQQTSDGGFIITGETLSEGSGVYDVWLLKTDSDGNLLWDKTFDVKRFDFGSSVQQTSDGGYIICGSSENIFFNTDGLLIKTDSNGEKEWSKTYDKSFTDVTNSVQQTTDGGYILTGSVSVGPFTDVWLIKTDANGNAPNIHGRSLMNSRLFELFPNLVRIFQFFNLGR